MALLRVAAPIVAALFLCVAAGQDAAAQLNDRTRAPFVPTPHSTVEMMLRVAGVGPGDIHYDLGSGDGRISIAAVRNFGAARSTGIDIDPERVQEGTENAEKAGVSDRVRFVRDDVFAADFSDATVVTMYLLQNLNIELRPKLLTILRPGTRIVSYEFHLGEWEPDIAMLPTEQAVPVSDATESDELLVYFWTVPATVSGQWAWEADGEPFRLELRQDFQKVSGTLRAFGGDAPIASATLGGTALRIEAAVTRNGRIVPVRLEAEVSSDVLRGTVEIDGVRMPLRATKG